MGPRQVGKTTIALNISETVPAVYLDLEDSTDLEKVTVIKQIDRIYRLNGFFSALMAA